MKICSRCEQEKDLECFLARKDRKSGIASACNDCVNAWRREKAKNNPEKVKEQNKKNYEKHREKRLAADKKYRESKTVERLEKDKEYRRKWYAENRKLVLTQRKEQKDRINAWQQEYEKKRDAVKRKANAAVGMAIRNGSLNRPLTCSICGTDKYKIQGHHEDYTKPLEVTWVCTFCHSAIHKLLKERNNGS